MKLWRVIAVVLLLPALGAGTYYFRSWWNRALPYVATTPLMVATTSPSGVAINFNNEVITACVGEYLNESQAYLRFQYVRSIRSLDPDQVRLVVEHARGQTVYRVYILFDKDLMEAVNRASELEADRYIDGFEWRPVASSVIAHWKEESSEIAASYEHPAGQTFDQFNSDRLLVTVRQFLLFKSKTDRRIQKQIAPVPAELTRESAALLASHIVEVARFYDLPLDVFLGIGAMENNYMNVEGDLGQTIWKRSPESQDIVILHEHGRALVWDYSIGLWQIALHTLQKAQQLYLADCRDYSNLPPRLRPPEIVDIKTLDPAVLTTYAGLWLRYLIDYFHGDLQQAAGAYNGGVDHPNDHYAEGVEFVASLARQVLGHDAPLQERTGLDPTNSLVPAKLRDVSQSLKFNQCLSVAAGSQKVAAEDKRSHRLSANVRP